MIGMKTYTEKGAYEWAAQRSAAYRMPIAVLKDNDNGDYIVVGTVYVMYTLMAGGWKVSGFVFPNGDVETID